MDAVVLACTSAVLFGGLAVAIRLALRRGGDPETGALVTTGVALVVCLTLALATGAAPSAGALLPFALAGVIAPGASQLLFFRAVRDAGPARAAVLTGTAPLFAATIAVTALDEPVRGPLVAATLLIVAGGVSLAG